MRATEGVTEFEHIPDWFKWQRECVLDEIRSGTYKLETEVDIGIIYGYKSFNEVGRGKLIHDNDGFRLHFYDGGVTVTQPPIYSYSINADFYWYEGGDIVSIGNTEMLYYCFPPKEVPVAKIRLASEALYKLSKGNK
jgi:hypothetical protein